MIPTLESRRQEDCDASKITGKLPHSEAFERQSFSQSKNRLRGRRGEDGRGNSQQIDGGSQLSIMGSDALFWHAGIHAGRSLIHKINVKTKQWIA